MSTPEQIASDLKQLLSDPAEPAEQSPDASLMVVLAPRYYLDRRILQENQTPRILETLKDDRGVVLLRRYDKLTRPIWHKYRGRPDCRPLLFVCESPLFVINDINATFLIPDDFQFLGALYASMGDDMVADQFLTEALKTGSADALINAAVYRYHRGERGVVDNFYVAKKNFNKALSILHQMPLTIEDKTMRRKMCVDAIDEIDYRFASIFDKIIRFFIRLLTFHFETQVKFVGPGEPKEGRHEKMKQLTESICKREFDLEKAAACKFVSELHEKIPVAHAQFDSDLQEIETEITAASTPDILAVAMGRLSDFYFQNESMIERDQAPVPVIPDEAEFLNPLDVCSQLAPDEAIGEMAKKYKLTSLSELIDLSMKPVLNPAFLAYLVRDRLDDRPIMEQVYANPAAPDVVKRLIQNRYALPGG